MAEYISVDPFMISCVCVCVFLSVCVRGRQCVTVSTKVCRTQSLHHHSPGGDFTYLPSTLLHWSFGAFWPFVYEICHLLLFKPSGLI